MSAASPAGSEPGARVSLAGVLAAVRAGAATPVEVGVRCGLDTEVARMALDELARAGLLSAQALGSGCPDGGCRVCTAGCATTRSRGPVPVGLRGWSVPLGR